MRKIIRKLLKWLLYIGAAGTMLLALLVGIARLLLPLVPEYQEDIRQWTAQATGYDVEFRTISASWPLAGPELQFIDVAVSARDSGEQVFVADNLTAGISLFMLVTNQKLLLNRLGVDGSRIAVRRSETGDYFFQGLSLSEFLPGASGREDRLRLRLPSILIRLQNIELDFTDESDAGNEIRFGVETLDINLSEKRVAAAGDIELDERFGDSVSVALDIPTALFELNMAEEDARRSADDVIEWRIDVAGSDLNLVSIAEYALKKPAPVSQARGDLVVSMVFGDFAPQSVLTELDLENIGFRFDAEDSQRFETLSGRIDWQRNPEGGWQLNLNDFSVELRDLFSERSDLTIRMQPASDEDGLFLEASAGFLRAQDLYPLVRLAGSEGLIPAGLLGEWGLPSSLRGEIRAASFKLQRSAQKQDQYSLALDFVSAGAGGIADGIGFGGLSGTLRADQEGGSLQLDANQMLLELPALFNAPVMADELDGLFVWRATSEAVRILSDDVRLRQSSVQGKLRFELDWPLNGDSPSIDLTATAMARSAPGVVPLLPLKKFPAPVSAWLGRAILDGRITNADIKLSGPLQKFPFANGEGVFRVALDVEQGVLDYADGWPRITDFSGNLVFDGPGLYSNQNRGRIGQIDFVDSDVRIENLRAGLLEVEGRHSASVASVLNFLRLSPLSVTIGPIIDDVTGDGELDAAVRFSLPVTRANEYQLNMTVTTTGTNLGLSTLDWGLSDLSGTLQLENTRFRATAMSATLLDEPVSVDLLPSGDTEGQFGQYVRVSGRTPVERWAQTLSLPFAERVEGPVNWRALVLIPRLQEERSSPLHILVRSDLVGMQSRLPAPLAKSWSDLRPLEIDVAFPAEDRLEVSGRLLEQLNWTFELAAVQEIWNIQRGAIHAGTARAILPSTSGIEITGSLPSLVFDDWLSLTDDEAEAGSDSDWQEIWRAALLQIDRLALFGQVFDAVQVEVEKANGNWQITLDAPAIAGTVTVPLATDSPDPLVLDLRRLSLTGASDDNTAADEPEDPRRVPAAQITVDEFILNDMQLGSLQMTVKKVATGIEIDPIRTQAPAFSITGKAAWQVRPDNDAQRQTRLELNMTGNKIERVLTALGYDPVIEGKSMSANGELTWLGGPRGDFLERADGTISIAMKEGALLDLEPGGGRILGILSVAALPRRLSLDFSDIVDEGLAFDSLKGDFTLDDGNAYTCNLSMEGPVADMGIVGRAGFATRDYDQIAVVRPHMSNLMAAGGFVVGGPVAGAAMLLFSQIFQKPLSMLGESYHSVTGSWDEPTIEQLRGNDIDSTPLRNCEQFLAEAITESLKE